MPHFQDWAKCPTTSICPVRSTCMWCGSEILFGASATRLEAELRLCSACPKTAGERKAIAEAVVIGMWSASGEPELPGESWLMAPPYTWGSEAYHAWKRGWWAGHFAAREDGVEARFALDVNNGTLQPSGG